MKTMNKKGAKRAADFVVQGSILAMAGILVRIIGMILLESREMDIIPQRIMYTIFCLSFLPTVCRWLFPR